VECIPSFYLILALKWRLSSPMRRISGDGSVLWGSGSENIGKAENVLLLRQLKIAPKRREIFVQSKAQSRRNSSAISRFSNTALREKIRRDAQGIVGRAITYIQAQSARNAERNAKAFATRTGPRDAGCAGCGAIGQRKAANGCFAAPRMRGECAGCDI
jgi:hypothetical protein